MWPRDTFEIVHIIGIAMMFVVIGGVAVHAANGGRKATSKVRKPVAIVHGIGSLLIPIGGFGMLLSMGYRWGTSLPWWLWAKIGVWVVLSGISLMPYRRPILARPYLIILPLLAGVAAYMARYKPF